ncbi:MAG TPA: hypothetical protein VGP46_13835, partial [Acidimicrobiales bacterium]|nr:hypothetical protein [Acidimicrobiales bacterium]
DSGTLAGAFSIASGAEIDLTGGNADVSGTGSGAGTFLVDGSMVVACKIGTPVDMFGGELDPQGSGCTLASIDMTGGTVGDTSSTATTGITDTGTFTWTGGTFAAPTGLAKEPTFTQTGGGADDIASPNSYITEWTLALDGLLSWSGTFYSRNDGSLTSSGTITVTESATALDEGSGGTFTSKGALNVDDPSITVEIGMTYDLVGKATVTEGTLVLGGDGGTLNSFSVAAGQTLDIAPSGTTATVAGGTNNGSGTLEFSSGGTINFNVALAVSNVLVDGSTTTTTSTCSVTTGLTIEAGEFDPQSAGCSVGSFDMSAGTLGDGSSLNTKGLTDTGSFTWTGGSFEAPNGIATQPTFARTGTAAGSIASPNAYITNWAVTLSGNVSWSGSFYESKEGLLTISGDLTADVNAQVDDEGTAGGLDTTNAAALTVDGSGATASLGVPYDLLGTTTVTEGTLEIGSDSGTMAGAFSIASGGTLDWSGGDADVSGKGSGAGTFEVDGATVTACKIATPVDMFAGELDPQGSGCTLAALDMTAGTLGDTTSMATTGITDTGTFTWTGGAFEAPTGLGTEPTLTQTGGGADEISSPSNYIVEWTVSLDGPLSWSGTFYSQHGGALVSNGAVTVTANAAVADEGTAGTMTVKGALTVDGSGITAQIGIPYDLTGKAIVTEGTLELGGDAGTLNSFTVASGAVLDVAPSGSETATVAGGTNSGAGTVEFEGGGDVSFEAALDVDNVLADGAITTTTSSCTVATGLTIESGEFDPQAASCSVGSFDMSGGTLGDASSLATVGLTDTGAFTWTGGAFEAPNTIATQPTFTQTGAGAGTISSPNDYITNWGVALDGTDSWSGTFYSSVGGSMSISGAMTVTAAADLAYEGGGVGTFTVESEGSLTEDSGLSLSLNITLVNDGTINAGGSTFDLASMTNSGTMNVEEASVAMSGSYTGLSGSTLSFTLGGTSVGTNEGQMNINGSMTIAGTLDVTTAGGFTPTASEQFVLAKYTSESGSFATVHDTGYGAPSITSSQLSVTAT